MRTASMVLGITAGAIGIVAALLVMLLGGIGSAFEAEGSGTIAGLGFGAILLAVPAIVGGVLAKSKPHARGDHPADRGHRRVHRGERGGGWSPARCCSSSGAFLAFLGRRKPATSAIEAPSGV